METKLLRLFGFYIGLILIFFGCVADDTFDAPQTCADTLTANITFSEVKQLYVNEVVQIREDWVIEGYVISSDEEGNFFAVLHLQDDPTQPSEGLQLEVDLFDTHLWYPTGSTILVNLKGLYLGKSNDTYKIGGLFPAFGNLSVGRLPAHTVRENVFLSCGEVSEIQPMPVTVPSLNDNLINTLIRLDGMEIIAEELESTYAEFKQETIKTIVDCEGNPLELLNSGFSDFYDQTLPEGNGSITGVLAKDGSDYQLVVRSPEDIQFNEERCIMEPDTFTSDHIFFSELADPNNNTGARFVELYNAASESLNLNGWTLRRYTNSNTEISSSLDLSGYIIMSQSALVISPNASEFELVYGFAPDVAASTNGPADSNGDDNLELVDPFGTVIDTFGRIGEDGSGTNHEFEDGKALRNPDIVRGSPVYNPLEWVIYNDTGEADTVDLPQNAPEDFSPGERN